MPLILNFNDVNYILRSGFSINKTRDAIIGRGTYGTVYKARRDADKFPCAAKVLNRALVDPINPDQTETTIRKIKEECVFLESLRHTNIVQYLGITRDREMRAPVLLMELLPDAESLTMMLTWFRKDYNEPLPYFIELNICCDIASAVDYLHSKNIIIRNLSSNNILVVAKTRAKVADFGMCRINDAINIAHSGTTAYMPPEALEKEPVYTPKFDCFSQGVLMIQVCTRKMPDPGYRINMGEASSGTLIPEYERQIGHVLSRIQHRDDLLLIAKDCIKDNADDRPTSSEIHERLATLKMTREYQNSFELNCEKLWKDITIHTRFFIDSKEKMKILNEERHKENVGEESNVNVVEQFEQVLRNANKIYILVVGTSGDGVSTVLNGLFGEEKYRSCENTNEFTVLESIFRIRSAVNVTVIDCRNLHANLMSIESNMNKVIEKVKPHGIPDLILYSQKMGENIDVVSQMKHKSVMARLTAAFANLDESRAYKDIWKRCLFVLTFANEYEISLNEQRDKEKRFNRRWYEWKMTLKQTLNDSKVYVPMKVCIAGFRESKLHQSDHWLSDIWLAAFLTLPKSGALALLRINAFRFVQAALSFEDIHPAEQFIVIDQSVPLINNAAAIAGIGAAGTASVVTGAAIGGTIGALSVGIVSFGVAAGSGLALGIVLGSVFGLGVSTAGIKYYRENKNFAKLPPL